MAQPYRDLPGVRPSKNRAPTATRGPGLVSERKETSTGARSARPSENYAATAHPAVRNQFIAPIGGGRSHIHHDNDGFSHQEPECAPPLPQHHLARPRAWGFGSIRSPITACRRRVARLMLQFPPTSHARAAEMSCNHAPLARASSRRARTPQPRPHRDKSHMCTINNQAN